MDWNVVLVDFLQDRSSLSDPYRFTVWQQTLTLFRDFLQTSLLKVVCDSWHSQESFQVSLHAKTWVIVPITSNSFLIIRPCHWYYLGPLTTTLIMAKWVLFNKFTVAFTCTVYRGLKEPGLCYLSSETYPGFSRIWESSNFENQVLPVRVIPGCQRESLSLELPLFKVWQCLKWMFQA